MLPQRPPGDDHPGVGRDPPGSAGSTGAGGGAAAAGGRPTTYPPPPPPPPSSRSSFLHHLPPPFPSASSPHGYTAPGHPPGLGDLSSWSSERDRLPPSSSSRSRWSPVLPGLGDRPSSASRLPSLTDFQHRPVTGWDATSPGSGGPGPGNGSGLGGGGGGQGAGGYPTWVTRPTFRPASPGRAPSTSITDHRHVAHLPPHARHSISARSSESSPNTPYPPTSHHPSPSELKHPNPNTNQKLITGDASPPSNNKKKRRVALSCAECAKRKQRCNRETPCQHCLARRVPELCVPYTRVGSPPPKSGKGGRSVKGEVKGENGIKGHATSTTTTASQARPPSMLPTLSVRVARVEALLNAVVNRVDGLEGKALSDWRISRSFISSRSLFVPLPFVTIHSSLNERWWYTYLMQTTHQPQRPHQCHTMHYLA